MSYGQKKKLQLIALLLVNKKYWLLDDPFNGLDDESITKVSSLIKTKIKQNGSVIIASHADPFLTNTKEYRLDD